MGEICHDNPSGQTEGSGKKRHRQRSAPESREDAISDGKKSAKLFWEKKILWSRAEPKRKGKGTARKEEGFCFVIQFKFVSGPEIYWTSASVDWGTNEIQTCKAQRHAFWRHLCTLFIHQWITSKEAKPEFDTVISQFSSNHIGCVCVNTFWRSCIWQIKRG